MARPSSPAADVPFVILAGGLGTRMLPRTEACPKMLLPVAGEPFAAHQLRWLADQGVSRVVIATGHLGSMIEEFIGDGTNFGLEVSYAADGPTLLGTGGAVRNAVVRHDLGGPVGVLYGDSYLSVDIGAVVATHRASGLPALMVVYRNRGAFDRSNAAFDGRLVRYDKHVDDPAFELIDYGLSVFETSVIIALPADEPVDLAEVQARLSADGQLAGFEATERFYEIGSRQGLADLEVALSER
jgi:NDP-sugar pyrophosphorylase family protein